MRGVQANGTQVLPLLSLVLGSLLFTTCQANPHTLDVWLDQFAKREPAEGTRRELHMPGVRPPMEDYYACSAFKVDKEEYIVQYAALAEASTAHHILLFGCDEVTHTENETWACGNVCRNEKILYAWARNADPTKLPDDVGFHIGGTSGVNWLVMQVHYARTLMDDEPADSSGLALTTTQKTPKYQQGVVILGSGNGVIPPHTPSVAVDVSCHYPGDKQIHPFAFRTHAHALSRVVTAYKKIESGKWEELGKGNPLWPQAFYPMKDEHSINPGDILVARCMYNSTSTDTTTHMGATHKDEMCNFYMMYYVEGPAEFYQCWDNRLPDEVRTIPEDSKVPLPPNPLLDEKAGGHHHHHGMSGGDEETDDMKPLSEKKSGAPSDRIELRMPEFKPEYEDYYACTAFSVSSEKYITQYEALANANTAHHILLFGCADVEHKVGEIWACSYACQQEKILYAWARNADPTKLPPDVGFHVGGSSGVQYLVMQVHYARLLTADEPKDRSGLAIYTTPTRPKYEQGVLLMSNNKATIPANTSVAPVDISCKFNGAKTIHPFAYRTHAHAWSRVVSAYKVTSDKNWELLGKGNPLWPQAFYPMTEKHVISPNDILVGRCVYNTSGVSEPIKIGMTHNDEMCNFYMMYYVEGSADFYECMENLLADVASRMPRDSLTPLPPNPLLDEKAGGHHHHGMGPDEDSSHGTMNGMKMDGTDMQPLSYVNEVTRWFKQPSSVTIGAVAAVDIDSKGNIIIFHRGSHEWTADSFDILTNIYKEKDDGAISEKTLIRFNSAGSVVNPAEDMWGENLFYMPHGLTIDHQDNIWVTDVAMHQVFKFAAGEKKTPTLSLGEAFKPSTDGSDESRFCKPTDVAVRGDGYFFVSDGYCNSRIVMFHPNGEIIRSWGSSSGRSLHPPANNFMIPHALTLSTKSEELCVSDRENKRVQCFTLEGEFKYMIDREAPVFSAKFIGEKNELLMVETNQMASTGQAEIIAVTGSHGTPVGSFKPKEKSFGELHDVAVSKDGQDVYIAQTKPPNVWKFKIDKKDSSVPVQNQENKKEKPVSGIHPDSHDVLTADVKLAGGASHDKAAPTAAQSQKIPILIAILLVVPIVCVLLILLGFKIYNIRKNRSRGGNFDRGDIFNRRKGDTAGFAPLTSHEDTYTEDEEDEHELETRKILPQN